MTDLEEIKDTLDNYCDTQVRASNLRDKLRTQIADAGVAGVTPSDIAPRGVLRRWSPAERRSDGAELHLCDSEAVGTLSLPDGAY